MVVNPAETKPLIVDIALQTTPIAVNTGNAGGISNPSAKAQVPTEEAIELSLLITVFVIFISQITIGKITFDLL